MKSLIVEFKELLKEERWDIDYHLPPVEIAKFDKEILTKVESCATIIKDKKNPTLEPEKKFIYIDISAIDNTTGIIVNPQELVGEEAPSRARKLVKKGDIIISTCRPTRGAIAIVPEELDGQICSTGFSVIRANKDVNTEYLHFVLRSESTKEQFRKFSTGSSYPAILDDDVLKTLIPLPNKENQDKIAKLVTEATKIRNSKIEKANKEWNDGINSVIDQLKANKYTFSDELV